MNREIRPFDCAEAQQHLMLHAGSDLESASAAAVEAHVAECEPCREELARARRSREHLAVLGRATQRSVDGALADGSANLWPALRARLEPERKPTSEVAAPSAEPAVANIGRATIRTRRIAWIGLPLAAAAALVISLRFGDSLSPSGDRTGDRNGGPALVSGDASRGGAAGIPGNSTPTGAPANPVPDVAATGFDPSGENAGQLRRAGPEDERLRDMSLPFGFPRPRTLSGSGAGSNSLASDAQLR